MKNNDWKDRLNVVFSTNPDFKYESDDEQETVEKLPNEKQKLRIELDKRNRKGKAVTLITGYVGSDDDLGELARMLKTKCGSGGSSRCGEILIQGDFRQKVNEILQKEGYKTRVI
ncbi:MAG: translation initiation factor [Bacteroidales bacterium]